METLPAMTFNEIVDDLLFEIRNADMIEAFGWEMMFEAEGLMKCAKQPCLFCDTEYAVRWATEL